MQGCGLQARSRTMKRIFLFLSICCCIAACSPSEIEVMATLNAYIANLGEDGPTKVVGFEKTDRSVYSGTFKVAKDTLYDFVYPFTAIIKKGEVTQFFKDADESLIKVVNKRTGDEETKAAYDERIKKEEAERIAAEKAKKEAAEKAKAAEYSWLVGTWAVNTTEFGRVSVIISGNGQKGRINFEGEKGSYEVKGNEIRCHMDDDPKDLVTVFQIHSGNQLYFGDGYYFSKVK